MDNHVDVEDTTLETSNEAHNETGNAMHNESSDSVIVYQVVDDGVGGSYNVYSEYTNNVAMDMSDVPFGWRHKLEINNKTIKQSKLFKSLILEDEQRDNMLPSISHN